MCVGEYACVYLCVEALDWYQESSSTTVYLILRGRVSLLSSELTDVTSLSSQLALGIPRLHHPSAGITGGLPYPPSISVSSEDPN